jgi:hypothetical protein
MQNRKEEPETYRAWLSNKRNINWPLAKKYLSGPIYENQTPKVAQINS